MKVKKPYHHGALRQALVTEAFEALEKDGLEALSLRGLAAEAGVSKTAPYRHFADKRELLVTLAAEGFKMLADVLEEALADAVKGQGPSSSATNALRALFRAYLGFARSRPALYGLMVSRLGFSLHSESCRLNSLRAYGCLEKAVEMAQTAGWRAGQDASALAASIWANVHGWAGIINDGLFPEGLSATSVEALESATEALLQ